MKSTRVTKRNGELIDIERALGRAARRARQLAQETRTPFYVWKSERVVNVAKSTSGNGTRLAR